MDRIKDFDGLIDQDGRPILPWLLREYLRVSPQALARMQAHAQAGSLEEVFREAHSLKSTSANIGATRLAELCEDLEMKTEAPVTISPAQIRSAMSQIETEFAAVAADIELLLAHMS